MTVYLLHFTPAYKHAKHYLGSTAGDSVDGRLARHRAGDGARLVAAIVAAGGEFELARTWPGGRDLERRLKRQHNAPRLCPICRQQLPKGDA